MEIQLQAKFVSGNSYTGGYSGSLEDIRKYLERLVKSFELLDEETPTPEA